MGRKDAEPDAYNRRIFRFCAGWLERVMQAIAEAALLPPVKSLGLRNFWVLDIFQPSLRHARPGGLSTVGLGAAFSRGRVSGSTRETDGLLLILPISQPLPRCPRGVLRAGAPLFHRPPSAGAMVQALAQFSPQHQRTRNYEGVFQIIGPERTGLSSK